MSSLLNDIEDFTTDQLRDEIRRRENADRQGQCWYCGQNLQAHTCKYAQESPCPGWEVKPPRFVRTDGGCMGDWEEYWVVDARNPVTGTCRKGTGATPSEATENCIKSIHKEMSIQKQITVTHETFSRPIVVCLCGSTRFPDAFIEANRQETLAGKIVLSVGLFGHGENMDMDGPIKAQLDELHLRKIDLSDEILVLNVNGYLGDSTRREIAYAVAHNKTVRYLEQFGQSIAVIKPL